MAEKTVGIRFYTDTAFSFVALVENKEYADALTKNLKKLNVTKGKIAFFYIPDISFSHTQLLDNGSVVPAPSPPPPWIILT